MHGKKYPNKSLTERANTNLIQNTVQLLVLNVDSFIIMIGRIMKLVTETCGINKRRSRKIPDEKDSLQVETVLQQFLFLYDVLILNNKYKYHEIETRMNMETGGVLRQLLVVSSLDCIKANNDYEDQQSRYHKHEIAIEQMKQQSKTILKS
uniref:Uncharacterized protein n=1 Tax=Amphimedon queenslandica TaxID=400682 RepID=A0A1X7SGR4_AMPQE